MEAMPFKEQTHDLDAPKRADGKASEILSLPVHISEQMIDGVPHRVTTTRWMMTKAELRDVVESGYVYVSLLLPGGSNVPPMRVTTKPPFPVVPQTPPEQRKENQNRHDEKG